MLISFSVENYRSFADEQTLSMEAVKDDAHPDHVVDCGRFSLLKTAALYGANASGKSNLMKAFKFMREFVATSATKMNLGDRILGADYFRLDKARGGTPCSFDIRILLNDTEYQYGFSATNERVHDEWLFITRKGMRATNPLSRTFDPSTGKTDWKLRGELKSATDVAERTRDNGLFLSRAAEMNVEWVKDLFLWFVEGLSCSDCSSLPGSRVQDTARRIEKNNQLLGPVARLLHDADLGIVGLFVKKEPLFGSLESGSEEARKFQQSVKDFLTATIKKVGETADDDMFSKFAVQVFHRLPNCDETIEFSLENEESNGTRGFFGIIGPILDVLGKGHLLVVDELDCSMHPHLTYKLVEMFQSAEMNPKGAQLVFATHDTNLMTPALFRRDEIWLTEKNDRGGTELFSLADVKAGKSKPRKDDLFEKHYLAGRYGGIPSFGPALEDIGTP